MSQPPPPPPPEGPPPEWTPGQYAGPPPGPYGAPQPGYGPPPGYGSAPNDGMATAALICGIASFVCVGVVLGIVAIVLGYQARNRIDASGGTLGGRGMATAGMICGAIGAAVSAITVAFVLSS